MNSTDVRDEHAETADSATVLRQILDLTGRVVGNSEEDLQRLPSGIYLLLHDTITRKVLLMR
jgi:hypothetical protein